MKSIIFLNPSPSQREVFFYKLQLLNDPSFATSLALRGTQDDNAYWLISCLVKQTKLKTTPLGCHPEHCHPERSEGASEVVSEGSFVILSRPESLVCEQ